MSDIKIVNYKNQATGLAESFEAGSRGERKRRADPKHYTCLNPEAIPKPKEKLAEGKPPDGQTPTKK